jgi:hypothetical protein
MDGLNIINKGGQVTIFIIVAIVIVAAVGLFFVFRGGINLDGSAGEHGNVYSFVEECIIEGSAEAIYEISLNGGHRILPELSTESGYAYYYINSQVYMPSKEFVEDQISSYVEGYLADCVHDFRDFSDLSIYKGNINVDTDIRNEEVIFDVNYPLTIIKANKTSYLKNWNNIQIDVRLGVIYNSIFEFIDAQTKIENICLTCLMDVTEPNDLYVELQEYYNATIFSFRDENSIIQDKFLEFKFANEY